MIDKKIEIKIQQNKNKFFFFLFSSEFDNLFSQSTYQSFLEQIKQQKINFIFFDVSKNQVSEKKIEKLFNKEILKIVFESIKKTVIKKNAQELKEERINQAKKMSQWVVANSCNATTNLPFLQQEICSLILKENIPSLPFYQKCLYVLSKLSFKLPLKKLFEVVEITTNEEKALELSGFIQILSKEYIPKGVKLKVILPFSKKNLFYQYYGKNK